MKFTGLYTAIITPFKDNGKEIDYVAYKKLLEKQIEAGVAGVVPCGTTGESPTLSHEEHNELIAKTVEFVNKRIKVIAGAGSNSTLEAIKLSKQACSDGVDALMLVSPYYNKPTQLGLIKHFLAIADEVQVPIMIYNIKSRTSVNIEVETLEELAKHKNIKAIKEASGDPVQMIKIQKRCGDKLSLLCGDDNITPAFMGLGGNGVVSVASNIYPKRMMKFINLYLKGDFKNANILFYEFVDFMNTLFIETNPIPVKTAAGILNLCSDTLRLPLTKMTEKYKEMLSTIIKNLGEDS